jgi:hypothetical protein
VPIHNKESRHQTGRVAGLKVLHVTPMPVKQSINWEHPEDGQDLDTFFEYSGSTWCCVVPPEGKLVGHIHYDMLPDKVGTEDRHGFKRTHEFQVNRGP